MSDAQRVDFDEFAGEYDRALAEGLSVSGESKEYFAKGRIEWLRGLLDAPPARVLDYGCGTGSSTPYLLDVLGASHVTGVDVSRASLAVARETYAERPADFRAIDDHAPDAEFDLAFTNGVFHHIPPDDRAVAVAYVWRALRPGGVFAFWENNPWNPGTRYVMHKCPFDADAIMLSPPEAKRLVVRAGFEIDRLDFLFVFPRALSALRPLEARLAKLPVGAQYLVLAKKASYLPPPAT